MVRFPFAAINPAKLIITKVFPSPEIDDEIATTFASLLTKLMLERMERMASAILDFDDSLTTT